MTITIVQPSIENLQQFSDSFDIEKLLQSEGVLPWLLANGWDYNDESCLIANIVDESNSVDELWDSEEFDFQALPDESKSKLNQIFEHFYLWKNRKITLYVKNSTVKLIKVDCREKSIPQKIIAHSTSMLIRWKKIWLKCTTRHCWVHQKSTKSTVHFVDIWVMQVLYNIHNSCFHLCQIKRKKPAFD